MSFELSPVYGTRPVKVSGGSGLSIAATLISPLLAVLLSQYLHTQEKRQTTFALPVPDTSAVRRECQYPAPSLESAAIETAPDLPGARDSAEPWQGFTRQPERQALAKRLIEKANETKDELANQLMLLRTAKHAAAQAGDVQTAFQAIDAMAETSHVDANAMKMAVLTRLAAAAQGPAQHKSVAEQASRLADQAMGQDQWMVARQLGRLAQAEARKSCDRELAAKVQGQCVSFTQAIPGTYRGSPPTSR